MAKQLPAALLTTSTRSDVKRSGGKVAITDLEEFSLSDILAVERRQSKDEVAQVHTIGGTNDPTITASTQYIVRIGYVHTEGTNGEEQSLVTFRHVTPATLSGNAATDRSNVYNALADKINANSAVPVTAAADVGGSGAAMTITDDGSYFAARPATDEGRMTVKLAPDPNGGGFDEDLHLEITTAGVLGFGDGDRIAADEPVIDPVTGNLVSGEWEGASGAVSGQKYDGFYITTLQKVTHNAVAGLQALGTTRQLIYVDNGTGTSTTNAAGFAEFLREMERIIYIDIYGKDPSSLVSLIDSKPIFGGILGPPTGSGGDENLIDFEDGRFTHHVLGTQTIVAPTWTTAGLDLVQDVADNDGNELSAPVESVSPKQFVVGQQVFSVKGEFTVADITDLNPFDFGFRRKEAFQADVNDYDEMASIGIDDATGVAKDIKIRSILNGAATSSDDSGEDWADTETKVFEVRVALDGSVSFLIDGVDVTDQQTTAFSFDDGEVVIPFVYQLAEGANDSGLTMSKFFAIPDILAIEG